MSLTTYSDPDCCLQEVAKKEKEREKERQEEKEKIKKRRSSSKEKQIPRSPSGEAAVGPVPTSMKIKPDSSLGAMAQPRQHGERRVWSARGYHVFIQTYTCAYMSA